MRLDLSTISFNANVKGGGGTPAWGTAIGQGEDYKFNIEAYDLNNLLPSMVYCSIENPKVDVFCPLGKGGSRQDDYEYSIASLYHKVFVNGMRVINGQFVLLIVKQIAGKNHIGRRTLKYGDNITYQDSRINEDCYHKMATTLGLSENAAWFVNEIFTKNLDELHFKAYVLGESSIDYSDFETRRKAYLSKLEGSEKTPNDNKQPHSLPNEYNHVIYYGAPGTGKSFQLKKDTESFNHIRTIFHPDSDYASFIGCYKPVMNGDKIKYDFRAQAFINAYVNAWLSKDPYYLIIEEINRGNCAQIFGDIFQLLDRKNGVSDYTIVPDTDLKNYLHDTFHSEENQATIEEEGLDIPNDILDGTGMRLPANFFLRATMNTSDQSLFPMDSAFKRRWAWKHFSIKDEGKGYKIEVDENHVYDWWETIDTLNRKIYGETKSADKQIGYWFAKLPDNVTVISKDDFVSTVLFYLWNDVFKDYGFDSKNAFSEEIQFDKFFTSDGKVDASMVVKFMENNGIKPEEKESTEDSAEEEQQ